MGKANLEQEHQVAELSMMLAVALNAGLSLVGALDATFSKASGIVAESFQRSLAALELGSNLFDELDVLRKKTSHPAAVELVVKLQVSLQFGSPLSDQLMALSRSLRQRVAQHQLSQAAKRENLMLLPLVFLILPVTVLFAVYPSLQYLNLNN